MRKLNHISYILFMTLSVASLAASSKDPVSKAQQGIRCMEVGKTARAKRCFDQVVASRNGEALNHIGIWYTEQKEYLTAMTYFNQVLEEQDCAYNRAISLNNLGAIHITLQRYTEALDYFDKASEALSMIKPTDLHDDDKERESLTILFNIGTLYHKTGDEQKALAYFHRAALLDIPEMLNTIACAFFRNNVLDTAHEVLSRALLCDSTKPVDAKIHNNLGLIYVKRKDFIQARKHFGIASKMGLKAAVDNGKALQQLERKQATVIFKE